MLSFISMIKFSSKMFSSFSGVCCYGKYFLKLTENTKEAENVVYFWEAEITFGHSLLLSLSSILLCHRHCYHTNFNITATKPPFPTFSHQLHCNHHPPPPPLPQPSPLPPCLQEILMIFHASQMLENDFEIIARSLQGCNQTKENKSCDRLFW